MLVVENLAAAYGSVSVLNGVSLQVGRGEVLTLLGRNGVGKTTLMRCLTGLMRVLSGRVALDGVDLTGSAAHAASRRGLALVPQGRGILARLSVAENIRLGSRAAGTRGAMALDELLQLFPPLRDRLRQKAGTLSGGQQQQLAIARALASRPSVLLLDEPSEGIQPNVVHDLGELISRLSRETGLAVLLVEQNIDFALRTATRGAIMEKGRIVHEGRPEELRDDAVLKKYLAI